VPDASAKVSSASDRLAAEVQQFFVTLRSGPMERREQDDPSFNGPSRRTGGAQNRSGGSHNRKVA
jgi:methyl-accepting chemotaxis protein